MYKAIGFDYGGVLNLSKPILPGFAEIIGVPMQELREHYYKYNHQANVGDMSYEDLWSQITTELGHADKIPAVIDHMHQQHTIELNQPMLDLVAELRKQGYRTGLLSNNTTKNGNRLREEGLDKYFDVFLISAEIGYQKPSVEAFNLLLKDLEVLPGELIFVDDSESSLSLAGEIGYRPILFKDYEDFKAQLVSLKVLDS